MGRPRMVEPEDWQEAHSPTSRTEVVISQSPRRVKAGPRRRVVEERLWSSFTPDETRAAEELCRVWGYLLAGMTAKAQTYERTDPSRDNGQDIAVYLVQTHNRWRHQIDALERSVCHAILFDGLTGREAAKAYSWTS